MDPVVLIEPFELVDILESSTTQKDRLEEQGTLKSDWRPATVRTRKFIVVDTDQYARRIVNAFLQHPSKEVAFDTEGINLSRTGMMTVITMCLCDPCSIAYIFDLLALGPSIFEGRNSLRDILESHMVTKITFDCRTDSDALFHQYGVTLVNCLDLQVFQLGVKIQNRKYVVGRDNGVHEWVKGMAFISGGYLTEEELRDRRAAPPCHDMWGERPLEAI